MAQVENRADSWSGWNPTRIFPQQRCTRRLRHHRSFAAKPHTLSIHIAQRSPDQKANGQHAHGHDNGDHEAGLGCTIGGVVGS
jgi:hypothetical protein